jgi:hypothetical protein
MTARRSFLALAAALAAGAALAQARPKIAVTSLVGDTITVSAYRDQAATHMAQNHFNVVKMPGPLLDLTVLKTAEAALARALPGASVALLRVPVAGGAGDPARVLVQGKVDAANPLVDGLRKAGYTHLVTVTKLRAPNAVRLRDGLGVGKGYLEGLGFYADPTLWVNLVSMEDYDQGFIAPHAYLQFTLVDVAAGDVRATRKVLANSLALPSRRGVIDPWDALTAQEKLDALDALIQRHVAEAVPLLFQPPN